MAWIWQIMLQRKDKRGRQLQPKTMGNFLVDEDVVNTAKTFI